MCLCLFGSRLIFQMTNLPSLLFHRVPNVVEFYSAFQDENYYYIVMEYCPGGDLLEFLLRDRKAMSERRCAANVAFPLLATISRLHELNIIHRDIKLENIFLDASGRVRLGDFGLTMSMRQEAAISPVGTVEYMAPEVVALPSVDMVTSGRVRASTIPPTDEKVDIWALGVTLYELVTGRLPFEGKDKAEIKAAISSYKLAVFPPYVGIQCQNMICSMLAYDPEDRPAAATLMSHPFLQMHRSGNGNQQLGMTVTLEVRAGPPAQGAFTGPTTTVGPNSTTSYGNNNNMSPFYQNKQGQQQQQPRAGSVTNTPPGPPLTGFPPMAMSASSREVSSSSLTARLTSSFTTQRADSSNNTSAAAAARAGANAWAALRRLSGGQSQKSGSPTPSTCDTTGTVNSAGGAGTGSQDKPGMKQAVRRLFSRQSAPHRVQGGKESPTIPSSHYSPMVTGPGL
jgi:serine/threonine protein kinase